MDKDNQPEKRQHVRAALSARAKIKPLDKDLSRIIKNQKTAGSHIADDSSTNNNYHTKENRQPAFHISDFSAPIDNKADPSISHIVDSIYLLNDKLDRIIDMIEEKNEKNNLSVKETINICGTGMNLILFDPVEKGQLLDISLNIPGFPLGVFNSYGEVIWARKYEKNGNSLFEVGIKFINISTDEREKLIAYAFSQQRKSIRQLKEEKI